MASLIMGCAGLPPLEGRTETAAFASTGETRLGRALAPRVAVNPAKAGIYPLTDSRDAFAARVLLADAADKSLDVQYYIWRADQTGTLLLEALWRAAERGVRVRLLLDDQGSGGIDEIVSALDAHPGIEVRLYNPFANRKLRAADILTDFSRLNRRMHNKSFTVDNQATVVGGRNIGNEYFAAGSGVWFRDFDVMAIGPVVREVSKAFDLYWNSASAYPAERILGASAPDSAGALRDRFVAARGDPVSQSYTEALKEKPFVRQLLAGELPLEWTAARLLRDDPAKTLDNTGRTDVLLLSSMLEAVGRPARSFELVSPYFVPGERGTEALAALARQGVKVRVLTNSLAATDVSAVHAGYAKRRHDLLRAGVVLYELKPSARSGEQENKRSHSGSSDASLHAKTFAVDGSRIFVGSFNFDARSALLNTEMGLLIDSTELAGRLVQTFESGFSGDAYEVRLAQNGQALEWIESTPSGERRHDSEPGTGVLKRLLVDFLSLLPIDWML